MTARLLIRCVGRPLFSVVRLHLKRSPCAIMEESRATPSPLLVQHTVHPFTSQSHRGKPPSSTNSTSSIGGPEGVPAAECPKKIDSREENENAISRKKEELTTKDTAPVADAQSKDGDDRLLRKSVKSIDSDSSQRYHEEKQIRESPSAEKNGNSSNIPTKRSSRPQLFPRPVRRLIVRRHEIYSAQSHKPSLSSPEDVQQIVGTYKRTPVAQSEIRDSFGHLILKPAPAVSARAFYRHRHRTHHHKSGSDDTGKSNGRFRARDADFSVTTTHFSESASLPLLNVMVLLDPQRYVKSMNSSTVRSGTEAARRILRGRQEWLKTVRKHAERGLDQSSIPLWPNKLSYSMDGMIRRASYRLTGHGVPRQLLQDHIDYAGSLLSMNQATSVVLASKDSIRVRRPDGSHHNAPVPEDSHSLDLYMAVMERITRTLAIVLHSEQNTCEMGQPSTSGLSSRAGEMSSGHFYNPQDQKHRNGSTSDFAGSANTLSDPGSSIRHPMWHVEFTRGWVIAEPIVNQLEPVVEWIWPRQICIRLRGRPKNNPRMAVALAYDTTFPKIV